MDTIGLRRAHTFYINNALTGGNADLELSYGRSSDRLIIGNWNGDGTDTPGVDRSN